jgi:hypothetical protein
MRPVAIVLLSSAAAALALGAALALSRDAGSSSGLDADTLTPERASEEFMAAYRTRDFAKAASWSTGELGKEMQKRARSAPRSQPSAASADGRRWVLQESHVLREDKLRFVGVLVEPSQDESAGWPVALTIVRRERRYLVEDLFWPKGPAPAVKP